MLERRSIDLFRSTARFFAHPGEQGALTDDFIALMVLRHYGIPTRLLDWTMSPYVAAYFAACDDDTKDGEIWAFDEPLYESVGRKQWEKLRQTTRAGTGHHNDFDAKLTAFTLDEPDDWFCCGFYPGGFARQNAQAGAYTITPRFNSNHASAIASLLDQPSHYHRYVIKADFKRRLLDILRETHGIWRGSLYPDSAGAADIAREAFNMTGVDGEIRPES
jgi:hypothetical protein